MAVVFRPTLTQFAKLLPEGLKFSHSFSSFHYNRYVGVSTRRRRAAPFSVALFELLLHKQQQKILGN